MFAITILLAIMGLMGTDLFVPSLPTIANTFHETQNHTQLLISLFLAGFALSQLFYGPISDYVGRKPPLIFGVIIFIVASIICIEATTFNWLCIGRIIQGIGVGAGLSLARVVLRDAYQGTPLAIRTAKLGMFISLTPAIAPFVGGFLQQRFGFHSSFVFMLCYGLLLLILLLFFFKETIQVKNKNLTIKHTLIQYGSLLKNKFFMRYVMISGLAYSSIILFANIMPFIVQNELKLSPFENGEIILLAALGISVGSLISSRIVHRISPEKLIYIGLLLFVISGFLMCVSHYFFGTTLICLIPLIFMVTFSCGFIFPNAVALCFSHVKCNIGIAGAIYGSSQIFISMLVNFLLNTISHQDQTLLGIFYFSMGVCGLILCYSKKAKVTHPTALEAMINQ